jgi:hypothetical protein
LRKVSSSASRTGGQLQVALDFQEPVANEGEGLVDGQLALRQRLDLIEQVGELGLARMPASGRGHHDYAAARVLGEDVADLVELAGVRDAGTPEFADNAAHKSRNGKKNPVRGLANIS